MIDDHTIAELYETLALPGTAHFRATAGEVTADDADELEDLREQVQRVVDDLEAIPEPAASAKHTGDCWRRHARCLADRLLEALR